MHISNRILAHLSSSQDEGVNFTANATGDSRHPPPYVKTYPQQLGCITINNKQYINIFEPPSAKEGSKSIDKQDLTVFGLNTPDFRTYQIDDSSSSLF